MKHCGAPCACRSTGRCVKRASLVITETDLPQSGLCSFWTQQYSEARKEQLRSNSNAPVKHCGAPCACRSTGRCVKRASLVITETDLPQSGLCSFWTQQYSEARKEQLRSNSNAPVKHCGAPCACRSTGRCVKRASLVITETDLPQSGLCSFWTQQYSEARKEQLRSNSNAPVKHCGAPCACRSTGRCVKRASLVITETDLPQSGLCSFWTQQYSEARKERVVTNCVSLCGCVPRR